MPTYTYRREDGTTFDIDQRISEDPLTECPTTGQSVQRVITGGAGLIFKGSGFYLTDYARKGNGSNGSATNGAQKSDSNGSATSGTASGAAPAKPAGSSND